MEIGVIGVNHKSADVSYREKLALSYQESETKPFFKSFTKVVLFTCNRFEVYFHSPHLNQAHQLLMEDFTRSFNHDSNYKLYSYFGKDCFLHLAKVTSGLDSAIVGETEIQGQVKQAYRLAKQNKSCTSQLHYLFQKSLKLSKGIRQQFPTKLHASKLNLAVHRLLKEQQVKTCLFVGLSDLNQKLINLVKHDDNIEVSLTNRTDCKAQALACNQVQFLSWGQKQKWQDYDAVIFATSCSDTLIQAGTYQPLKKQLLIDLSVPRDVDADLNKHPMITLYNIDEIDEKINLQANSIKPLAHKLTHDLDLQVNRQIELFHHHQVAKDFQTAAMSLTQV